MLRRYCFIKGVVSPNRRKFQNEVSENQFGKLSV